MNLDAVPVLMYHSVKAARKNEWVHPMLSLTLEEFYRHLRLFKLFGCKSFFFDDLVDHIEGKNKLPNRSLILTFDDGYRDNLVFAFPLLKKYGLKATIWVNPEFVDDSDDTIAPTLEDYWNGKVTLQELQKIDGFLNWAEMHEMEKSGIIDIQSHTMSHTKYPISDEIVDFVAPDTKIDWLHWNLFPEDKINFLREQKNQIPLGYPIYKSERGNIARKVTENGELSAALVDFVKKKGGTDFFNMPDWKKQLFEFSDKFKKNNPNLYTKETEEEYEKRLEYELVQSKSIIENKLNKAVNHVCWPFGGWDAKTIEAAVKYGYITTTAKGIKNTFGRGIPERIDRISLTRRGYRGLIAYPYSIYRLFKYKLA